MGDFSTGIPYIPSNTTKKIANARKRLRIRDKEVGVRALEAENDRLKLALEEEKRNRADEVKARQRSESLNIMGADEVLSNLSGIARESDDEDIRARVLCKLADVYTLSKRDHGADTRVDTFTRLAGADDDALDAALNRGVTGQ